jgi:hypothetical protein
VTIVTGAPTTARLWTRLARAIGQPPHLDDVLVAAFQPKRRAFLTAAWTG